MIWSTKIEENYRIISFDDISIINLKDMRVVAWSWHPNWQKYIYWQKWQKSWSWHPKISWSWQKKKSIGFDDNYIELLLAIQCWFEMISIQYSFIFFWSRTYLNTKIEIYCKYWTNFLIWFISSLFFIGNICWWRRNISHRHLTFPPGCLFPNIL